MGEEDGFTFEVRQNGIRTTTRLPPDIDIGEVIRVFRGFLISASFAPESVDQYLTPE